MIASLASSTALSANQCGFLGYRILLILGVIPGYGYHRHEAELNILLV